MIDNALIREVPCLPLQHVPPSRRSSTRPHLPPLLSCVHVRGLLTRQALEHARERIAGLLSALQAASVMSAHKPVEQQIRLLETSELQFEQEWPTVFGTELHNLKAWVQRERDIMSQSAPCRS